MVDSPPGFVMYPRIREARSMNTIDSTPEFVSRTYETMSANLRAVSLGLFDIFSSSSAELSNIAIARVLSRPFAIYSLSMYSAFEGNEANNKQLGELKAMLLDSIGTHEFMMERDQVEESKPEPKAKKGKKN